MAVQVNDIVTKFFEYMDKFNMKAATDLAKSKQVRVCSTIFGLIILNFQFHPYHLCAKGHWASLVLNNPTFAYDCQL